MDLKCSGPISVGRDTAKLKSKAFCDEVIAAFDEQLRMLGTRE